jgi:hypothetical protein
MDQGTLFLNALCESVDAIAMENDLEIIIPSLDCKTDRRF